MNLHLHAILLHFLSCFITIECFKHFGIPTVFSKSVQHSKILVRRSAEAGLSSLKEPNFEDMKVVASILANITEHLNANPGYAMKVVSDNMGFLYSRNVPILTQMLLKEYPELRQDKQMLSSFMFLMDFLEAVTKETTKLLQQNQELLKIVLEAAKTSEMKFDEVVAMNQKNLTSTDFMIYLDTEIESQDINTQLQSILVTIKLRLLDELGKSKGIDVMMLPKLAAESDSIARRENTLQHIKDYPIEGCELFLMTLQLMRKEMAKRYKDVDPMLVENLKDIERIVDSYIQQLNNNNNSNNTFQ